MYNPKKELYISLFSYFLFPNMSKNVSDLNQPLMEPLGIPRSISNNQISYQAGRFRSAAAQPTSNSHLEKLLIMLSFKLLNQS